jgi:hypothetical protein
MLDLTKREDQMSEERSDGQASTGDEIKSAVRRAGATMQDTANKIGAETSNSTPWSRCSCGRSLTC